MVHLKKSFSNWSICQKIKVTDQGYTKFHAYFYSSKLSLTVYDVRNVAERTEGTLGFGIRQFY